MKKYKQKELIIQDVLIAKATQNHKDSVIWDSQHVSLRFPL